MIQVISAKKSLITQADSVLVAHFSISDRTIYATLALFAALGLLLTISGCTSPPPPSVAPPSVLPAQTEQPWDPFPDAKEDEFSSWVQEFLPVPLGVPYGNLEVSETKFRGEWDLAIVGQQEFNKYVSRLILAKWTEESRSTSASTSRVILISPDEKTRLEVTSTLISGLERFSVEAERIQKAGA